jgi:hypothetical protein
MRSPTDDQFVVVPRCERVADVWRGVPRRTVAALALGLASLALVVLPHGVATAATDTVTNCGASGAGSLPAVVAGAASGDTVTFALAPPCSTITLSGPIHVGTNLTIEGPGATSLAVSEGTSADVFDVAAAVTAASISGLTIENGTIGIHNAGTLTVTDATVSTNGSNAGGGIVNSGTLALTDSTVSDNLIGVGNGLNGGGIDNNGGTVTVTNSTLARNAAANGSNAGGIYTSGGPVTITGSTLSGNNTGKGNGGGLYIDGGTVTISDSTLVGNSAVDGNGGGIDNAKGTLTVTDSTVARNTAYYSSDGGGIYNHDNLTVDNSTFSGNGAKYGGSGGDIDNVGNLSMAATIMAKSAAGGDCAGSLADLGYNLDDDGTCGFHAATDLPNTNPDLDSAGLQSNGGPTQTIALQSTSPAIGAVASAVLCSTPDQRGAARPTPCDIGAVQFALAPQGITSADNDTATVGESFSFTVTTSGTPAPSITKKGKLPKGVKLVNQGGGTASLSGVPKTTGVYHVTIVATFGSGKAKHLATQPFTLTVDPAP